MVQDKANTVYIVRFKRDKYGTFGRLYWRGKMVCYTLEPSVCDNKTRHGVPAGIYTLDITYSPKFGRPMPLLIVPKRSGIRIHSGNTKVDTRGCILVGREFNNDSLRFSQYAMQDVLRFWSDDCIPRFISITEDFGDSPLIPFKYD